MAYPFCAHAHLPNDPPTRTDSPNEPLPDPFELTMQAIREIKAAQAAYRVIECIQSISNAAEARELMLVSDAEFKRRVEIAMTTLRSMRSPGSPRHQSVPPRL